ncbi:MAG: twin-arginine translocase subunit TatC [Gammaproteobacteria bacterium]|nr:twin-arginine translocase subunit TatC [Gammaproteobacteria bacterium]
MADSSPPPDTDTEQPLIAHLAELRNRLLRSLACVFVIFLGLSVFANDIYALVAGPLLAQLPEQSSMIATEVAAPFLVPFKLTFFVAVLVSVPYLLYQAWAFVAPGLYQNERRLVLPLISSSVLLFYLGIAFAFYIVFPLLFAFLTSTAPVGVTVMTDIGHYLNFILKMFFAFGVAFEVPIAIILLVWTGIATVESLAKKRPYIIVGAFTAGMLLTPPDIISQVMLAVPVWLLFELGLILGRFVKRRADDTPEDSASAAE